MKRSSLVTFFNCKELSDGTLEITEEEEDEDSGECPRYGKRTKLEECVHKKRITLSIHSLLFCSNSDFFRDLLMPVSNHRNIRLTVLPTEAEKVISLVKLFYDDSTIDEMLLVECVDILTFAMRYRCKNLCEKLSWRISSCKIYSISNLNQTVQIYSELVQTYEETTIVDNIKAVCIKYLKKQFCPCEKISGPIIADFLSLSFNALLFFVEEIESGMAVTEETVISLVIHWITAHENNVINSSKKMLALLSNCRFENITDVAFLFNVLSRDHPVLSKDELYEHFYVKTLEYFVSTLSPNCLPDYPQRLSRQLNFARDHDVMLYFKPFGSSNASSMSNGKIKCEHNEAEFRIHLDTCEKNSLFVKGYEINLSAGILCLTRNKELQVNLCIKNLARSSHGQIPFAMLYSIASPSISDNFSPWSWCSFLVKADTSDCWRTISLIAEHSLVAETGFYLKLYME